MKLFRRVKLYLLMASMGILISCNTPVKLPPIGIPKGLHQNAIQQLPNTLNDLEKTEGWVVLFDGNTTKGWRGSGSDSFPQSRWNIEDNALHCIPTNDMKEEGHDILSENIYGDFELDLEWKVSEKACSGIYFLAQDKSGQKHVFSALKMQISKFQSNDNCNLQKDNLSGSLFEILSSNEQNDYSPGQWNHVRILSSNGFITFYQNSEKILEFNFGNKEWNQIILKRKYKGNNDILIPESKDRIGHIGFQDCKSAVWFRNIKIRIIN